MANVEPLRVPRYPERTGPLLASVPTRPGWPTLDPRALYGLPGHVVQTLESHTEADPAALLATFLVGFGSAVGPGPHAFAEGSQHPARLFAVVVGQTAKARKGTSYKRVRQVLEAADSQWAEGTLSGLASGEGLVKAASMMSDPRVFVHEGEFARVLKVAGRDGATLSPILRDAWDGGTLRVLTKEPITAKDRHISILGHITVEELQVNLSAVDTSNGFGNRFLFVCARRARLLPSGGNLDQREVDELGAQVAETLKHASGTQRLHRTPDADEAWSHLYRELAGDEPGGVVGALASRADAQVLRLSVAYALTDANRYITVDHLEAAHALWRYCRDSLAHIFGDSLGDPEADKVLAVLSQAGGVMRREDLCKGLSGHLSGRRLDRVIERLEARGRLTRTSVATRGRPGQVLVVV